VALTAVEHPTFDRRRRSWIGIRILAPEQMPPVMLAAIGVEERSAARTPALLGEERLERRDGVDLAPAAPARKSGHDPILSSPKARR
jgi:hypothetical protein